MSEMNDKFYYNFYDYMKTIYIYSHVKTNLLDKDRQYLEELTIGILAFLSISFLSVSLFKVFVIIFYFIFMQSFAALIKFIISLYRTRFKVNFCSSFQNAIQYLGKVCKKIYTFNFNLFDNIFIGLAMNASYYLFLFSSACFYYRNIILIQDIEKDLYYMHWFYIHFESAILVQLLFASFYACRNMKISTLLGFGLDASMNAMLFLGYYINVLYENSEGTFENNEPQRIMNIIFNTILILLNGVCLFNIVLYKKNSNIIYLFIY